MNVPHHVCGDFLCSDNSDAKTVHSEKRPFIPFDPDSGSFVQILFYFSAVYGILMSQSRGQQKPETNQAKGVENQCWTGFSVSSADQ
jgi:hypothetical protein